jgi:hypothetical protein
MLSLSAIGNLPQTIPPLRGAGFGLTTPFSMTARAPVQKA